MHDCCIRVTALLECFAWTLHKPHNRTGGLVSTMLSMPSDWGSTFGAISFHYDQIFMGNVPFTLWYQKGVWSLYFIVTFKTNKERWYNHHTGILWAHWRLTWNIKFPNKFLSHLIWKVSIWKIKTLLWLCNMKKKMTIILKMKEGTRRRGQMNFGTWKGTLHGRVCNCGKVKWSCVALFSL